jgi:hypothetical protein
MFKKCRHCGERKDSSAFARNRNEQDGLMRVCRACRGVQRKSGPRYGLTVKSKKCRGCLRRKAASAYSINRSDKTGLDRLCRSCKQNQNASRRPTPVSVTAKACAVCAEIKEANCFSIAAISSDGLSKTCKVCQSREYSSRSFPVSVTQKVCHACKIRKQASQFHRNQRQADGIADKCKECVKRIRAAVRHPIRASSKACSKCGVKKSASEFFADPTKATGLRSECKACSRPVSASYRRDRKATDPLFKFITKARSIANKLIRYGWNKSESGPEIIGCSYEHAFRHICTFTQGLSREEHVLPDGYHLDHNIPMIAARSLAEARLLSHWTNLQLLTSEENLRKKDNLPCSLVPIAVPMTRADEEIRIRQAFLLESISESKRFRGKPRWIRPTTSVAGVQ